jgi:phage gp36-like protein
MPPNPYATLADLTPRRIPEADLIQLTDDSGAGTINAECVDAVIVEASAEIESYCRLRYVVPLQASEQIENLCLDIVVYKLFLRRHRVPESARMAYEDAVSFLKDVSKGLAALDQQATVIEQQPNPASAGTSASGGDDIFTDDKLSGYV